MAAVLQALLCWVALSLPIAVIVGKILHYQAGGVWSGEGEDC